MKLLAIGLLLFSNSLLFAKDCQKVRAAFDIGSGTTKLKVAKVDTCKQKIIKMLLEKNSPVEYKQDLKSSKNNSLSDRIINIGIKNILALKKEAQKYNPSIYSAVATSAFRTAVNGNKAAKKISKKTGIKINIITQKKEAKIGFAGALLHTNNDPKNIMVWDIGGGSMQMTTYDGNNKYNVYEGKLASVSFKNHIVEEVQKIKSKNEQDISPNPISKITKESSARDAQAYAITSIPEIIKKKIKDPKTQIFGIGGVHYFSVARTVTKLKESTISYSKNMVTKKIKEQLNLNDSELGGGKYVKTSVSNLILVESFMEALKMNTVKTVKVNLADGLLISPELANK